ncbi:hypothetical protein FHT17_001317 [Novosphingobium sp. SG916]|nr:hypothetical protein [Novosphingobium sp. SG919]NMN86447.1 hypothetical protein [Novosphingobium sp. SG916]
MNRLLARFAPAQVVRFGRILALLTATAMTFGYVTGRATAESTAVMAYVLGLLILLSAPGQRSSELLGAQAVWMTVAEFLAAAQSGQMLLWRWAVSVAALAVVMVPLKIQHLRSLACRHPYSPLRDLERRAPAASSAVLDGRARRVRPRPGQTPEADADGVAGHSSSRAG